MGNEDGRPTGFQDMLHRGHDPINPRGISDAAIFDWHIDVNTGEHALAHELHVIQSFPAHLGLLNCGSVNTRYRAKVNRLGLFLRWNFH